MPILKISKGSFANYVTLLGGEGGRLICDNPNKKFFFLWKILWQGGRGARKSRFLRDVICERPLNQYHPLQYHCQYWTHNKTNTHQKISSKSPKQQNHPQLSLLPKKNSLTRMHKLMLFKLRWNKKFFRIFYIA